MKVDKFIGHSGFTSRQKAFVLIDEKRVTVNGKTATHSTKVQEGDVVLVDGQPLDAPMKPRQVVVAFNKPRGVECTTEKTAGNIIDAVGHKEKILPIGRLDKDSEGLILLTNIKPLIDKISNPKFGHEKEYVVTLNLPVRNQFLKEIKEGTDIGGVVTKPCEAWLEPGTKRVFRIVLKQGINRQIRRMCNKFGYQVIKLQRVRIMDIGLGKLREGEWRELTEEEVKQLMQ